MAAKTKVITIEKLFKGWIQTFFPGNLTAEGNIDQYSYSANGVSMFRQGKFGHIGTGETFDDYATDSGNLINGIVKSGCGTSAQANSELFILVDGVGTARVVWLDTTGWSTTNKIDISAHGGHSSPTALNGDIISFWDNSGSPNVEYVFYSWEDNTDGDIGVVKSDGTGQSDSWFGDLGGAGTNRLTFKVPHIMAIGPDKNLYCTNGQYIAQAIINGALASATGNNKALNIGAGFIATDVFAYGNYIGIIAYKSVNFTVAKGQAKFMLWDGFSSDPNFIYDLGDSYASIGYEKDGQVYAMTYGLSSTVKLKQFTGSAFKTIFESSNIGTPSPDKRQFDIFQDMPHWYYVKTNGMLGCWSDGFHQRSSSVGTAGGMLKSLFPGYLLSGGTSGKLARINVSKFEASNSIFVSRIITLPYRATIKSIIVYFSQFGAGASIQLDIFKDYASVSIGAGLLNQTITNTTYGAIADIKIDKEIPDISSFCLAVLFNHQSASTTASLIRKIEIIYEETLSE